MPQDLGASPPDFPTPGATSGSIAHVHVSEGLRGSSGRALEGEPEGARRALPVPPPGLVYTVTKGPFVTVDWAKFEQMRRLSKMRRRTITRARLQTEEVAQTGVPSYVDLVTYTYAPGHRWNPQHIADCMRSYRKQAARDGVEFRYEWVAELQLKRMRRRGESAAQCLHYHAIIWQPEGYAFPHPDTRGWWTHGMTNTESARNPVGYLAKYASKGTEGEALPRGARISGGGGLSEHGRKLASWWLRPRYVRDAFPDFMQKVQRLCGEAGGGWLNYDTGEHLQSPVFTALGWKAPGEL